MKVYEYKEERRRDRGEDGGYNNGKTDYSVGECPEKRERVRDSEDRRYRYERRSSDYRRSVGRDERSERR